MAYTLQIGALTCHILEDGKQPVDGGGFFGVVPRILWQRVIQPDADNLIPSATRALAIESAAGLILVDTGNGDKLTAKEHSRFGFAGRTERLIGDLGRGLSARRCRHRRPDSPPRRSHWRGHALGHRRPHSRQCDSHLS
ncbi:MAG: hypothetical protein R2932_25585 [Caldilineaceae bacterium]